jgi:hypothetical protein
VTVDGEGVSWGSELACDGVNECVEIAENIVVIEFSCAINFVFFHLLVKLAVELSINSSLFVSKVDLFLFLFTCGNE